MPSTLSAPRPRPPRPWLRWGVPISVLVLAGAVAGGTVARTFYREQVPGNQALPPVPGPPPAPVQQPGPAVVELSPDAAAHPDHDFVRALLQAYFDSINVKRYDEWKTTVVAARQREKPEATWRSQYATSQDGSIRVYRIDPGPDQSLRVMLSFNSLQDPKDAPPSLPVSCVHWRVVYPLVQDSGGLRVDTALPGSEFFERC